MAVPREHRYPLACLVVLTIWWAVLAIEPKYRTSWLHENALVFVAVPLLVATHFRMRLSKVSYTLLTVFLCLHLIGAHYTYSEVPLFDRIRDAGGFERNHYDRVVHFSFGLLLAYPMRELFMRVASARGFWSYYLPLDLVMAASMFYELIEWIFAVTSDPAAGTAFLGSQGDPWDAQKDMALATLGALFTMVVTMVINLWTDPGFRGEFRDSLRVKRAEPLGEVELLRRFEKPDA